MGSPSFHTPRESFDGQALVDHAKTLDCIHCGLCLSSCPTYRLSGAEPSSPRGRIHLMRAVGEGRIFPDAEYTEELDFCLLCRRCESVCPAGVRFGALMEVARDHLSCARKRAWWARALRYLGFRRVLTSRRVLRLVGSLARAFQVLHIDALAARNADPRLRSLSFLPPIVPLAERRLLPAVTPATGKRSESIAILEGCVMPELYQRVNRATVRSLSRLGVESHVLAGVVCCGSLHAHNGDLKGARSLARKLLDSFDGLCARLGQRPRVVPYSAGCGAHLRELEDLFPSGDEDRARATAFASRVVDYSEVVEPLLARRTLSPRSLAGIPQPLAWDDPCHLCHAQGVRAEPRKVLDHLGTKRVALRDPEACCGSAGIYSLLRPNDSAAVFEAKREDFEASGAKLLVTSNPGCQLQWESGLRRAGVSASVMHLAELVDHALANPRDRDIRESLTRSPLPS